DAVLRLGEQQLHVADASLREAGLAVAEVERPQTPEALVVAERLQALDVGEEVRAPAPQRLDVMRRDVLERQRLHVGVTRDTARDDLQRRQTATRKDVRVDEAARRLLGLVGAVVDRDR